MDQMYSCGKITVIRNSVFCQCIHINCWYSIELIFDMGNFNEVLSLNFNLGNQCVQMMNQMNHS